MPALNRLWPCLLAAGLFGPVAARAQIDPTKRELLQLGYNQPIEGKAPIAGYAFYYYNRPNFLQSNLTLRLAIAPVYLDSELGISHALGPNTDLGIGLAGGGYADSYYEVRGGKYLAAESFTGHGATLSGNIYHLFNPTQQVPLNGVFRGEVHYANYERDSDTAPNFTLPDDQTSINGLIGLRLGGKEPLMIPDVALELSAWYRGEVRLDSGDYGIGSDRHVENVSQTAWGRALFAYTLPKIRHNFMISLTAGTSAKADRFSAYRLGGLLPLASEFPLILPGYYYQEISASRFAVANVNYNFPLDKKKRWAVNFVGSTALIDYLPGQQQPGQGHWNSGVGGGLCFRSNSGAWQVMLDYGYGFNAIRSHGLGAQSVGILIQWNFVHTDSAYYNPGSDNPVLRGLDRFLHSFE